jgi:molybdopterin molybdotransferase
MTEQTINAEPSCADPMEAALLPIDVALERIKAAITPIADIERVAVREALGRVLSTDVHSPNNVPMHTNSAMDGYAFAADNLPAEKIASLRVVGTSWAGRVYDGVVAAGECVRIMTGAVMPDGTDTVEMQERVERSEQIIRLETKQKKGNNVRYAGEDLAAGGVALTRGHRVTPADLGLLASVGVGEVNVWRRPRVAFFSNGDELRSVGEPLAMGDVYDSNRYTLYGMLKRVFVDFVDLGVVPDDPLAIREAFLSGARCGDMLITSAGASVGEADFIQQTLEELGEVNFWKMAMKPGRPLAYGQIGKVPFFGLPGNPVSVMVTFYKFVRPALAKMAGETERPSFIFRARAAKALRKRPGRAEFQRGILRQADDGNLEVINTGDQGSGILHSMSISDCFIYLPAEQGDVEIGDWVNVEPFGSLI